jgi:hypothetical protein
LAEAQLLSNPSSLRHNLEVQVEWADSLTSSRRDLARRFLAVAEEIIAPSERTGPDRAQLLGEAEILADRVAELDQEIGDATAMVRETRVALVSALDARVSSLSQAAAVAERAERLELETQIQELKGEVAKLRGAEEVEEANDPLDSADRTLAAFALVVAEEYDRLRNQQALQEELRLFLGDLRLFDEMNMPPSARSGGGGSEDPGCGPSACAVGAGSPADIPMMHSQPEHSEGKLVESAMTPASLARLHEQITARLNERERSVRSLAEEDGFVTRETTVGAALVAFRGDGSASSTMGPKVGTALAFAWPLGVGLGLTVEPSLGGRAHRGGSSFFTELAGELRENFLGTFREGSGLWQVTSWQKGRVLSEPLAPPGYLEPGRLELGLMGRIALLLGSEWQVEAEGGADGVRYEPEDWQGLDRQGFNGGLGLAWQELARSARISLRASHYEFPNSQAQWEKRREDDRVGVEVSGALEGNLVARLSLGGSWNQSRLPAYDFWLARTAVVLSTRLGRGTLQGYAALSRQAYLNPGPEDARIAPSDQDSGSVLSLQYAHPVDSTHMVATRVGWSRSQTGFRNDFYNRFQVGLHLTFREM